MIETILADAAGAGLMAAKYASLTVRTGRGKPRLVGYSCMGVTLTSVLVMNTSKGWDTAGVSFPSTGNGAIASSMSVWAGDPALPDAIDLDEGSVFTLTQVGGGAGVCLLQLDYGGDYVPGLRPKGPLQTTRTFTAPGALTAVTVGREIVVDTFEPTKTYIPAVVAISGAFTGPQILVGIDYSETKGFVQFVPTPITNVATGADSLSDLKCLPPFKGRTQVRVQFYSTTTDTPVARVNFVSSM